MSDVNPTAYHSESELEILYKLRKISRERNQKLHSFAITEDEAISLALDLRQFGVGHTDLLIQEIREGHLVLWGVPVRIVERG